MFEILFLYWSKLTIILNINSSNTERNSRTKTTVIVRLYPNPLPSMAWGLLNLLIVTYINSPIRVQFSGDSG